MSFLTKSILSISLLCVFSAFVLPPKWDKLGSRTVNWTVDHDVIPVTAANGKYTGMKLTVDRSGVNFIKVIVHFGNNTRQDVALRSNIPAGGETRVIDFKGGARTIKKIDFFYEKNPSVRPGKAVVNVFGRR